MIPQIIIIVLMALRLLKCAENHGEPEESDYNFWQSLLGVGVLAGLLWWGGFWNVFK